MIKIKEELNMAISNENIQDLVMFVLTNNRLPEDGDLKKSRDNL